MNFVHCDWMATPAQEFGHDHHIQSCLCEKGEQMIVDLDSWEAGYGDGLLGRPSQRLPRSTGSRIRAATCRLAHVVQGRGKILDGAPLDRQRSGPLDPTVAVLG
jgi:hypothetical protein